MALVWTESCQRIRTTAGYTSVYAVAPYQWQATGGRNNGPLIGGNSTPGAMIAIPRNPVPSGNLFIAGGRLLFSAPANGYILFAVGTNTEHFSFGPGVQVAIWVDSNGLKVIRGHGGGTALANVPSLFSGSTLYYVATEIYLDDTAGYVKVWVDGTLVVDTGPVNTKYAAVSGWNNFSFAGPWALMCDIYCMDGSQPHASDPITPLLDARIDYIQVNGNGYVSNFLGNDTSPPESTDNYLLVDDLTPDSDTTYVEALAAGKDAYTLANSPVAGATIVGVTAFAAAKKSDIGVANAKVGLRSSGTDYMNDSYGLPSSYTEIRHHFGHDPANGAWTESAFNALEVVVEKV